MTTYYIYILCSQKDGKLYIGYTDDLKRRLKRHRGGFVRATKNRRPLSLIHFEGFAHRNDAKRREMFLKGGNGRKELKVLLKNIFDRVKYKYR